MRERSEYQREYRQKHIEQAKRKTAEFRRKHPEYRAWMNMLSRCNRPTHPQFKGYGGRGIKVLYKSWRDIIADIGPRPSPDLSIDRINNDGNYEWGNCRWATAKEQAANRRSGARR